MFEFFLNVSSGSLGRSPSSIQMGKVQLGVVQSGKSPNWGESAVETREIVKLSNTSGGKNS